MNYWQIYLIIGLIFGSGLTLSEWSKVQQLPEIEKLYHRLRGADSPIAYLVCWLLGVIAWPIVIVSRMFK